MFPHLSSRENAWLYITATFVALWIMVWLYRDSLEIEDTTDKYVFVSGCDSGFGNLLCKKLDRRGFRVLAGCLTEKGADDLKRVAGPNLKTVLLDVTSQDSIQKAMEWTKKEVGEKGERSGSNLDEIPQNRYHKILSSSFASHFCS